MNSVIHYLYDFLCIGLPESKTCAILLGTLQHLADCFGILLAPDKMVGLATELVFFQNYY